MRFTPSRLAVLALVAAAVTLTACSSSSKVQANTKSAGQELLELKEAKEKGLISDREYERMRKKIVREND